jgi:hypothetical protein
MSPHEVTLQNTQKQLYSTVIIAEKEEHTCWNLGQVIYVFWQFPFNMIEGFQKQWRVTFHLFHTGFVFTQFRKSLSFIFKMNYWEFLNLIQYFCTSTLNATCNFFFHIIEGLETLDGHRRIGHL